jgi:hypothetical protein
MASKKTMRAIGRRGGLRGGPARAKKLGAGRRWEIARDAATARWQPTILVLEQPRDGEELRWFVAQYGNGQVRAKSCDPVEVLLRAVSACRDDAGLARMIPVFVHRARAEIFADPKRLLAVSPEEACALGYFLELTCRLSQLQVPPGLLRDLRHKIRLMKEPVVLFKRELAARRTSPLARSWKLVLGEPDDSFESYFEKVQGNRRSAIRRMPSLGKRDHASS